MRTLPDYLRKGMKMILVGANPGDRSARVGHYYAGRGNQFWPMMYESGVIPEPLGYEDDRRVLEFGIGMTDLVKRPTRGIEEIERQEFSEGRVLLAHKLEDLRPRVIAFSTRSATAITSRSICGPLLFSGSFQWGPIQLVGSDSEGKSPNGNSGAAFWAVTSDSTVPR